MKTKIKYLITAMIISITLSSCGNENKSVITSPYNKRFLVVTTNNDNWTNAVIQCDSFKMESLTQIKTYSDGIMSNVYAKRITVRSNQYYKQAKSK